MLTVSACGYRYTHPDGVQIDRPQGIEDYVFVFYLSPAAGEVDGSPFSVLPGDCLLFARGAPHSYHSLETPFVNDWVHFGGGEAPALLARLGLPVNRPFRAPNPPLISRGVLELYNALGAYGALGAEIIDADLRSLLMKLAVLRATGAQGIPAAERHRALFAQLRGEVQGSPWRHPCVEELAGRVHMSASHFQHVWRALFGVSVGQDMVRSRVEYAGYLLEHSSAQVGEVSRLCGYDNEEHFMRIFKKYTGLTPSAYRLTARSAVRE